MAEILNVDDSGIVSIGIGTSPPLAKKLEVKDLSISSTTPVVRIIANDATPFALIVGNEARVGSTVDGIRMKVNSSDKGEIDVYGTISSAGYRDLLLQPNGGSVGIGTTAPDAKLHVAGRILIASGNAPGSSVGASGDKAGMIAWGDITGTKYIFLCIANFDGSSNIWQKVALTGGAW